MSERDHPYWMGSLAATIALALKDLKEKREPSAQRLLDRALREFLASPLPSAELKDLLRGMR
jgi:hypothetical protein